MQPYMGLGNSLQTAQGGTAGGIGGWVELGRTTLGSAGDTIDVTSLDDKRYYMVLDWHIDNGSSINSEGVQFNGDTGSNYAWRESHDGTADAAFGNRTEAEIEHLANASDWFSVQYIANLAAKEKLGQGHGIKQTGTGAATAPKRQEFTYKWANTANAIDQYTMTNKAAGSYDTGSEVVVLGWDAADTHTSNFWEELIDYTHSGGAAATSTSGTFTAKKYLWCQTFNPAKPSGNNVTLLFNSTTGAEYTTRYNQNGGSDATLVNRSDGIHLNVEAASGTATGFFTNIFIVNNSANEKLVMTHTSSGWTNAGAGVAPARSETVGKWANTSTQINQIELNGPASGIPDGTRIKVWGSD